MKFYKSYILAGLVALGFTACDTDDLERDINALEERVENYEAQAQKLNDNMNIIRVLLDGNKTISEYSYDSSTDTYTLKLSNGETLKLTQGETGESYPSIEIGDNGNWIIAGEDSGIKAVAEDGDDATYTPQFKIENGKWCVSHDNGQTWTNLGVDATGTATSATSPIKNVDASDSNYIVITLSTNQEYKIPVVKNLTCSIKKDDLQLADDGLLYFGYGAVNTIKVEVNIESGDIIRPIVPADWKAEITTDNYLSMSGLQTLEVKVTAPNAASKCVITMEVNRGANTITDEIEARTNVSNYWDEYQAGFDIVVGNPDGGNFVINKKNTELTAVHITNSSDNKTINSDGIYFIDSNAENVVYDRFGIANLIIIGTNPESISKLKLPTADDYFNLAKTGNGLMLKNIELDLSNYDKDYVINEGSNEATIENVIFDRCKFELKRNSEANLYFLNIPKTKTNIYINNIAFYSNKVKVKETTKCINIVRLESPDNNKFTGYETMEFVNNVFYSPQSTAGCDDFSLLQANMNETKMDAVSNITVNNNTVVNLLSKNGMMRSRMKSIVSKNNLIYNDYDTTSSRSWIIAVKQSKVELPSDLDFQVSDNTCYDMTEKAQNWMLFHPNGYRPENHSDYTFNYLTETPFEEMNITNGTFKVSSSYAGIGSSIE